MILATKTQLPDIERSMLRMAYEDRERLIKKVAIDSLGYSASEIWKIDIEGCRIQLITWQWVNVDITPKPKQSRIAWAPGAKAAAMLLKATTELGIREERIKTVDINRNLIRLKDGRPIKCHVRQ